MEDEKRRIRELRDEGFIEQLFRRLDGTGAYLVVTADTTDAVHERLDTLPFVEIGIMTMQVDEIETL
jgi:muconolactone delta-isomerase